MENDSIPEGGDLGYKCHICKSRVYINAEHKCFQSATRIRVDGHLFLHPANGPVDPNFREKLVLRCGTCRALEGTGIPHDCFQGIDNIQIDNNGSRYPVLDEDNQNNPTTNDSSSQQSTNPKYSDENGDPNSRHSYSEQPNCSDTIIEFFIDEFKLRPPLWNYHLPIQLRSPSQTCLLWSEVAEALKRKGSVSSDTTQIPTEVVEKTASLISSKSIKKLY